MQRVREENQTLARPICARKENTFSLNLNARAAMRGSRAPRFDRVIRDHELRRTRDRGAVDERAKGDILCSISPDRLKGPKKEKKSTANDEGCCALSKYVSFFFFFHPEHPAERAPLCISMHWRTWPLTTCMSCLCASVARVSSVIAARVHALQDLLARNSGINIRCCAK